MAILDIFANDAFTMVAMSEAVNKIETLPQEISQSGIFIDEPIRESRVAVEEREGTLSLVQTSNRGAPIKSKSDEKRKMRYFDTSRIARSFDLTADELQFIRDFNEEQAVKEVQAEIAQRLSGPSGILNEIRMTHENMRLGAMQGKVLDADGSQIYDYFAEFGITEPDEINFDLKNTTDGALRKLVTAKVVRPMMKARKGMVIRGIDGWCGAQFFDDLIANPEVRATYLQQEAANELREEYFGRSFRFAGVTWREYMGSDDGSKVAVGTNKVKFTPSEASGALSNVWAPGEGFDNVGTLGKEFYTEIIPENRPNPRFVTVEVTSYPLMLNKRPDVFLKGTTALDT